MTSDQIAKVAETVDWCGEDGTPMMNPGMSVETANLRATLEVAYQLALLNEQIGGVLNSRIAQMRVMVEAGDYPLQVKVQEGR
jgi:hypothetical protein